MSVSFLTRMAHFQGNTGSGLVPSVQEPLLLSLTSPSATTSSSSPPGSLCSLGGGFCSGSNFPAGNLSLQTSSPWTSGSGVTNPHRTASPGRADESLHSSSLDMIEAQISMRRAVAAAAASDQHSEPVSALTPMSLADISNTGSSGNASSDWNPFSLLPFIHGAALVSSAASFPTVTGSATTASVAANESALNAWSAAAAAAAAAYASLLPSGRTQHHQHEQEAESRRVRGERKKEAHF